MGLLKKISRFAKSKVGKAVGKAALTLVSKGKLGQRAQGVSEGFIRAKQSLKGAGVPTIVPRGAPSKPLPVSVQVNVAKAAPPSLPQLGGRVAMPGGSPVKGAKATKRRRKAAARPRKAAKAPAAGRKVGGARKGTIGGKGSLDLKATSKKWKAAGSPGRWIDYVKSSGVRR